VFGGDATLCQITLTTTTYYTTFRVPASFVFNCSSSCDRYGTVLTKEMHSLFVIKETLSDNHFEINSTKTKTVDNNNNDRLTAFDPGQPG